MRNPYSLPTIPTGHLATGRPFLTVGPVECTSTANTVHHALMTDALNRPDCERSKAAHRPDVLPVGGLDIGEAVRCFGTFVETNHEGSRLCSARINGRAKSAPVSRGGAAVASSLDSNVQPMNPKEMYLKEEHHMGTHMHPMEGVIIDLTVVRNQIKERFASDGEICSAEQAALSDFDSMASTVKHLHAVDRAADLYKRQGPAGLTGYGKRQWELAGLNVTPIEPDAA